MCVGRVWGVSEEGICVWGVCGVCLRRGMCVGCV